MKERRLSTSPPFRSAWTALLLAAVAGAVPGDGAHAQIGIDPGLDKTLDPALRSGLPPVDRRLRRTLEPVTEPPDELPTAKADEIPAADIGAPLAEAGAEAEGEPSNRLESTLAPLTERAEAGVNAIGDLAGQVLAPVTREFIPATDPLGQLIERDVLVVLYTDARDRFEVPGLKVLSVRPLGALGGTLVTYRAASPADLAAAREHLSDTQPGQAADFNHLFEPARQDAGEPDRKPVTEPAAGAPAEVSTPRPVVGLIDSALSLDHPAFSGCAIQSMDFVAQPGERPRAHGTAVASRLLEAGPEPVAILAASVFFTREDFGPAATSESIVLALEWLAGQRPDAINISLAGPPNSVLERALAAVTSAGGPVVVAAVGNEGPNAGPRYPAAWPGVVGVTAVDGNRKIYPFANRGGHVDFSAPGVDVPVALPGGGWGRDSGTSMAAPRVSALAAALRHSGELGRGDAAAALIPLARDLGPAGYDTIFGHGLLTLPNAPGDPVRTLSQD